MKNQQSWAQRAHGKPGSLQLSLPVQGAPSPIPSLRPKGQAFLLCLLEALETGHGEFLKRGEGKVPRRKAFLAVQTRTDLPATPVAGHTCCSISPHASLCRVPLDGLSATLAMGCVMPGAKFSSCTRDYLLREGLTISNSVDSTSHHQNYLNKQPEDVASD